MCGRYELATTVRRLSRHFQGLHLARALMPARQISPLDSALVIQRDEAGLCGARMRWGLVGAFLDRDPAVPVTVLPGEGLVSRPFYSRLLRQHRCLIPASAFVDGNYASGSARELRLCDSAGEALMIAGVFDHHPKFGLSCAMLSTEVAGRCLPVRRVPLILDTEACAFWLAAHDEFPDEDFKVLLGTPSSWALHHELLPPPEVSPQLAFSFV